MHTNAPSSTSDGRSPSMFSSKTPHPLAKFKQRSHDTHQSTHISELNHRLRLGLSCLPTQQSTPSPTDDYTIQPDLQNASPIHVIYLGNSMLERLKSTGASTSLNTLAHSATAINLGVGGDKNENILYRLDQGLHSVLKTAHNVGDGRCDIKLWILCSGTNNLHPKHGFRERDVQTWKALVDACLDVAPGSRVLACDVFYRKNIVDGVVERANEMLKQVVGQYVDRRVVWVEARGNITKEMLVDHVHLNESGYEVWDEVLWPYVQDVLSEGGGENGVELKVEEASEVPREVTK